MKPWIRFLFAGLFLLAAKVGFAQQPLAGVSMTSPLNEASGIYTTPVTVTATGVGAAGAFSFSFFVNGTSIGNSSGSPTASVVWTPPQPGSYFIHASVTDAAGNTATSLPIRYFATGTIINSPVSNTIVPTGSTVVLKADATTSGGFIKQIQFFDNGVPIGTDSTAPYSFIYTVPGAAGSPHSITAQATDNNNNLLALSAPIALTIVTAITPTPASIISSPANNAAIAIGGAITVSVDANSTSGRISKVELYLDGALFGSKNAFPYSFSWTPTVVGTYTLVALTYDDKNNVIASNPVTATIAAPPTVTVTSPTNGGTVTGGSPTQLRATATDSGSNAITNVEFFVAAGSMPAVFLGSATTPVAGTSSTYQITATLNPQTDSTGAVVPSVITARATNAAGISSVSVGNSVTVTSGGSGGGGGTTPVGVPPVVTITSPTASTQLTVNTAASVTAGATDSDGNVTSVQFFVNNTSIGTSTVYPYKVTWTPTSLGTYAITAKATDNDGNQVTSPAVTVTVIDPSPSAPTVSITSPVTGATIPVNTAQVIRAAATDAGSIASVQFFVNGQPEGGPVTKFPYSTAWTPSSPGAYILTARATNVSGNEATSVPVTVTVTGGTPPTISLASPGATIAFGATTDLTATATPGTGATIASVQFFANGVAIAAPDTTFPYSVSWTPPAPGAYVITAVATDSFGNQTTSTAASTTVTPGSTTAPFVFLTSTPTNTNVTVNTPVVLSAGAGDPDGAISSVGFFVNNQLITTATTAPYAGIWVPTTPGSYTVTAVATDDAGNRTTSAAAILTVLAQAGIPPIAALDFNNPKLDTPAAGAAAPTVDPLKPIDVTYGSKLLLSAEALDQDGTIASIQFFVNGTSIATVTSPPYLTVYPLNTLSDVVVTAIATDSSGNAVYTNPIFIATQPAVGVSAADVTLITPVNGGTYVAGRQITFSATHNFGNIDPPKIDFYVDGSQFTTVSSASGGAASAPYTTVLGITRAGTYTIHAVVRRGNTTTVSTPARITVVPNNAPTVAITSPTSGSALVVGNAQTLTANALDSDGTVQNVQFFVNGILLSSDPTAPFTATWSPAVGGSYIITAAATDDTGSQTLSAPVTVTVTNNQAPTVAITGPATGTTVGSGSIVSLSANAADIDGKVASVRFLANGVVVGSSSAAPFVVSWTPSAAGTYTVVAQATDDSGNVTSSSTITVNVLANQSPTVSITSPGNGATVRVSSGTTLSANAADADGTITNVQFFANGTAIGGPIAITPYRVQWIPNAEGIYRITAVATDNAGSSTTSSAVTVLAVTAGAADVVYTGNYLGGGESGRFALINVRGKSGALIAYSTSPTGRTYFFPSLTLDANGGFSVTDSSGRVAASGTVNDTGVVGSLDNGRVTMIGPAVFPSGTATVAAGYYNGNIVNRPTSMFAAIVGADGSVAIFAADGSFRDAGSGSVTSAGTFTVTTPLGNRFTGTIDPATGFLSGSVSGGITGNIMAANATGSSFSDGYLRNLSTRGQVGTGTNLLIAGFVVAGNSPKQVLIRAIGPTLSSFGIAGALVDTQLELFSGNTRVASNDNWGGDVAIGNASGVAGAFPLAPFAFDSVLLLTLAPGSYTAQVSGVAGRTGIALIELYDVDSLQPFSPQKITNVATRGLVGTGQAQLIAGFVVSGNTSKKVLLRAVGPTLSGAPFNVAGALADPVLRLVRGDTQVVRENDNWEQGNDVALVNDAASRVGAFPLAAGSRDAAIVINLPPGTYSAQVSGTGTTTGVALVEVYEVP
jgi:hypothetical protein